MVVGGGPAGMEAAYIAASRWHKVSLFEQSGHLGGKFRLATFVPGKREINGYLESMAHQMDKVNVSINLNMRADDTVIKNEGPEVLIVATGSKSFFPDIPGIRKEHVHSALDVLEGRAEAGDKIVIIGGGGVGCDTALCLARFGTIETEAGVF